MPCNVACIAAPAASATRLDDPPARDNNRRAGGRTSVGEHRQHQQGEMLVILIIGFTAGPAVSL